MARLPLCFVLMPFGQKKDPSGGREIDFNRVYANALRPAIVDAGLEPIRADAEVVGGIIHKSMLERLVLCDYALADLTTANANVFYELGVRHAVRPHTTVLTVASVQTLPFDVAPLRALRYELGARNRFGDAEAAALREAVAERLGKLRAEARTKPLRDSPLFELLDGYPEPNLSHLKTDTFRYRVEYSESMKARLAALRRAKDGDGLVAVETKLRDQLDTEEVGVLIDLLLSYRALERWDDMIRLYGTLPQPVRQTVLVREQYAFALNRRKRRDEALEVLREVLREHGPSAETYGLMGRVYKDRWRDERAAGDEETATACLERAIETYRSGFEADFRDAYPGINAVTLLDVRGTPATLAERDRLLPVVRYAVDRKVAGGEPDYWDHATYLELSVLECDEAAVATHRHRALEAVREPWEPDTTADNLGYIREARLKRSVDEPWLEKTITALRDKAQRCRETPSPT